MYEQWRCGILLIPLNKAAESESFLRHLHDLETEKGLESPLSRGDVNLAVSGLRMPSVLLFLLHLNMTAVTRSKHCGKRQSDKQHHTVTEQVNAAEMAPVIQRCQESSGLRTWAHCERRFSCPQHRSSPRHPSLKSGRQLLLTLTFFQPQSFMSAHSSFLFIPQPFFNSIQWQLVTHQKIEYITPEVS